MTSPRMRAAKEACGAPERPKHARARPDIRPSPHPSLRLFCIVMARARMIPPLSIMPHAGAQKAADRCRECAFVQVRFGACQDGIIVPWQIGMLEAAKCSARLALGGTRPTR